MDIKKQSNGNISLVLSGSDLIEALEAYFGNVFENITEDATVQKIQNRVYGNNIEIIIGEAEE